MMLGGMSIVSGFPASAHELSGYAAGEIRGFLHDALYGDQEKHNFSLAVQPEYYHEWENGNSFNFIPFARVDSADSGRTHVDIRELNALIVADAWELRVGMGKVFWGVTEFVHLVDIINQTDLVEDPDGEDKLGQPMVHFSVPGEWGVFDFFLLPGFRERTYPGKKGRLRTAWKVDTDHAVYESDAKEHHMDVALRYSHYIGNTDFGVYHFSGTGREPVLTPDREARVLQPYYPQIHQSGLDLQVTTGPWLVKLEALHRTGHGDDFSACTGGVEYTITGIGGTHADLGVLGEFAYDDRREKASTPYENDVMFGLRLAVNDMAGSEVLIGVINDVEGDGRIMKLEAGRRFLENWKGELEAGVFSGISRDDIMYDLRGDDYMRLEVFYYF